MILFQERESWGIYFQSRYALQYQQWTAISLLISVWLGRFWKHIMLSGGSLWRLSWNQLTSCLNFGIFNWPKKNLNLTQFIQGFQCKKNLHKLLFIWPSFLKAITEDNPRCWLQKSMVRQRSGTAWAGWTGKHQQTVFPTQIPSWLQWLLASKGSLEKKVLPFLLSWFSSSVKKV